MSNVVQYQHGQLTNSSHNSVASQVHGIRWCGAVSSHIAACCVLSWCPAAVLPAEHAVLPALVGSWYTAVTAAATDSHAPAGQNREHELAGSRRP